MQDNRPSASACIALGANLGDRENAIRAALAELANTPGCEVIATAPLLATEPWGHIEQAEFLNTVCLIHTTLAPLDLLARCLDIERDLGRDRSPLAVRWGPRKIDLDIILYADLIINEPELTIPHPQMQQRAFVLDPLCLIAPDRVHPVLGKSICELRDALAEECRH